MNEEGKINVEEVMNAIKTEFPKNAIPKTEFDSINEQLKTANKTIKDLEKLTNDNEELSKKLGDYETEIAGLKESAERTAKEYSLKARLTESGVIDADYLIYKHGGIDKFVFDKDGNAIGVDDILKLHRESMPHLFKTKDLGQQFSNVFTGNGNNKAISLEQQIDNIFKGEI